MNYGVCSSYLHRCIGNAGAQRTNRIQKSRLRPVLHPAPGFLHSVVVKGNKMYQTADIVKVVELKLGQPVTAADFAAAKSTNHRHRPICRRDLRIRILPANRPNTTSLSMSSSMTRSTPCGLKI